MPIARFEAPTARVPRQAAGPSGQVAVGLGHERGATFVPRRHDPDAGSAELVQDAQERLTRDRERVADAGAAQRLCDEASDGRRCGRCRWFGGVGQHRRPRRPTGRPRLPARRRPPARHPTRPAHHPRQAARRRPQEARRPPRRLTSLLSVAATPSSGWTGTSLNADDMGSGRARRRSSPPAPRARRQGLWVPRQR